MIPINIESAWKGTSNCRNCGIRDMVLFADLNESDFELIHAPIDDLVFQPGVALFGEGRSAGHVMTIRAGVVKLVRNAADGRARIVRILKPGDVIGLEALFSPVYDTDAVALSPVSVCKIPITVIKDLSAQSPRLHMRLMERWHRAVKEADDWLAALNFGTARQRVANIILKMRHMEDPTLTTLFSREDMGAMSDLKLETVSREVSRWTKEGVIEPQDKIGRLYRITSIDKLQAVD
uniref:Crp/Fnr family transcriptional regulator n=1 Tax=Orrella sp. TaxID=1921583 RepID=UPI004055827D